MRKLLFGLLACALSTVLGLATPAQAGYTTITKPVGEETHAEIFSFVYHGTFKSTGSNGLDFSNGSIYAKRVQDTPSVTPSSSTSLVGDPGTTDQYWSNDFTYASADAKFAVYAQNFGYYDSGNTYHQVFSQTGWGYQVGGAATLSNMAGQTIRFARGGENRIVSSVPSDNADGRDHMVTYEITGLPQPNVAAGKVVRTWMLFFEDSLTGEQAADADYNDLVVQIQAMATTVPEPTTLGMLSLGLLAMKRRRA